MLQLTHTFNYHPEDGKHEWPKHVTGHYETKLDSLIEVHLLVFLIDINLAFLLILYFSNINMIHDTKIVSLLRDEIFPSNI
jgi:hypothetical protein